MSPEEKAEVVAYVQRLYTDSGERSWAAFARRVGVSEYSLSDWRSGRAAPSAINLLRLQQAVGPAAGAATSETDFHDRLEELAELVAEGLARLEAGISRVEKKLDAEGGQAQGKGAR